mmetsp:Transcript_10820/g.31275  ORF Transcript_10820/g.31275 Transcript_10820/m.31275 type:complete len:200 (-) Transcript_10820:612-1211(-)
MWTAWAARLPRSARSSSTTSWSCRFGLVIASATAARADDAEGPPASRPSLGGALSDCGAASPVEAGSAPWTSHFASIESFVPSAVRTRKAKTQKTMLNVQRAPKLAEMIAHEYVFLLQRLANAPPHDSASNTNAVDINAAANRRHADLGLLPSTLGGFCLRTHAGMITRARPQTKQTMYTQAQTGATARKTPASVTYQS